MSNSVTLAAQTNQGAFLALTLCLPWVGLELCSSEHLGPRLLEAPLCAFPQLWQQEQGTEAGRTLALHASVWK